MKFFNRSTLFLVSLILLILVISGYTVKKDALQVNAITTEDVLPTGKIEDKKAVTQCLFVLKKNLTAANEKDLTGYLQTLVPIARQDTKKEMTKFFKAYEVTHTLLSFEVIKEDKNSMLIATEQQALNQGKKEFRDHISQVHHTFVKEKGTWYLQESIVTNTKFLN